MRVSVCVCVCVFNLHGYSKDTGPTLTKAGLEGHMPLLLKLTDEVDSWTGAVLSRLNTRSPRCDFRQHFLFSRDLSSPYSTDSPEIQRPLLIFFSRFE